MSDDDFMEEDLRCCGFFYLSSSWFNLTETQITRLVLADGYVAHKERMHLDLVAKEKMKPFLLRSKVQKLLFIIESVYAVYPEAYTYITIPQISDLINSFSEISTVLNYFREHPHINLHFSNEKVGTYHANIKAHVVDPKDYESYYNLKEFFWSILFASYIKLWTVELQEEYEELLQSIDTSIPRVVKKMVAQTFINHLSTTPTELAQFERKLEQEIIFMQYFIIDNLAPKLSVSETIQQEQAVWAYSHYRSHHRDEQEEEEEN